MTERTLNHLLIEAMDEHAARHCLCHNRDGHYVTLSFRAFRASAIRLAHYFRRRGIVPGDRIALVAHAGPEWLISFVAGQLVGAVLVPVRLTLPPQTLRYILQDSGAALAVVQGAEQCRIINEMECALPKTVLVLNPNTDMGPGMFPLDTILNRTISTLSAQAVREGAEELPPDSPALIIYTKCTDGRLRGALFDRGQIRFALESMAEWFDLNEDSMGFSTSQPWSELPSLYATLHYFVSGVPNALTTGTQTSFRESQHFSPTVTLTSPYAFEYIYLEVMSEIRQLPRSSQEVFQWALTVGKEYHMAGIAASADLRESYQRADMTFFNHIRGGMMGGRLRRLYSAGAPLPQKWSEFAQAIGLLPINVYSVTEAGGFPAASRTNSRRAESCGQLATGYQIRIADDGEILVRGEAVMRGYWNQDETTPEVIDRDGWLHTGDLGRFDSDGFLYITGHKQSLLILATGRKLQPNIIEERLTEHPSIAQAVVCGEGRRYLSALIAPDLAWLNSDSAQEALQSFLQPTPSDEHELDEHEIEPPEEYDVHHPAVRALIDDAVQKVNRRLDGWEQIEGYVLLDQPIFDEDGDPVSAATLDRVFVNRQYAPQIDALYPVARPFEEKEVTQVQLDPEHLRQLLEKVDILDAWMNDAGIEFLFDLARSKQIDTPSMVHICETTAAIAQMLNEERPLSTALIVGDPARIARILPESPLQLRQYDHIRRMRRVVTNLAKIVDGRVLAYAVDTHGYVRGIHKLEIDLEEQGSDIPSAQFRHLAAISRQCDALIFSVPAGGRQVRVFADGQLVGRYVNGTWLSESMVQIDAAVVRLAADKEYNGSLLRRLLRCAFEMSERNLGAILLLGDAAEIIERSDDSEIQNVAVVNPVPLHVLSDGELIAFAKQDGATVIDTNGELRGCMVLLRPAATTQAEIGPGFGARHSSAAKISAETGCVAVVVSQDGPISVYDAGQRVMSL